MNANRISTTQMNPMNNTTNNISSKLDDIHNLLLEFQKIYQISRDTVVETDTRGLFDDLVENYIERIPCCGQKLAVKLKKSNIKRLINGEVKSGDTDPMINTFALVFALLLTIVPNYSFNLSDGSVLGYLRDNIAVCNIDGTEDYWYHLFFIPMYSMTCGALYTNVMGLYLVCVYYCFRPSGVNHFQSWFKNCGVLFGLVLNSLLFVSVALTLLPVFYYQFWLDVSYGDLCNQVEMVSTHGPYALIPRYRNFFIAAILSFTVIVYVVYKMI